MSDRDEGEVEEDQEEVTEEKNEEVKGNEKEEEKESEEVKGKEEDEDEEEEEEKLLVEIKEGEEQPTFTLYRNFLPTDSSNDDENFYKSLIDYENIESYSKTSSSDICDTIQTHDSCDEMNACYCKDYDCQGESIHDPNAKWKVVAERLKDSEEEEKEDDDDDDRRSAGLLDIEYTLAIIKPDILKYAADIEKIIIDEGFEICTKKKLQMTTEQMSEFYKSEYGKILCPLSIAYMISGPIIVMVLCKQNAVNDWRILIGPSEVSDAILYFPDSIRAKFGSKKFDFMNAVHGSSTYEAAQAEIKFFFTDFIFEPITVGYNVEAYLQNNISPILTQGLIACCKAKSQDPLLWFANWLLENNPNKPKMIYNTKSKNKNK